MEKRTILIVDDDIANSGGDLIVHLTSDGAVPSRTVCRIWIAFRRSASLIAFSPSGGARGSTGLGLSVAGLLTERMGGTVQAGWHAGRLTVRPRAFSFGLMTAESRFCGSIGYYAFPWEKRRRIGFFCVLAGGIAICRRLVYTGLAKYKGGLPDEYSEYSRAL